MEHSHWCPGDELATGHVWAHPVEDELCENYTIRPGGEGRFKTDMPCPMHDGLPYSENLVDTVGNLIDARGRWSLN